MKQIKKETVIAVTFTMCIIFIFFCLVPTWYLTRKQSRNDLVNHDHVSINWEERYPFEGAEKTASKRILAMHEKWYLSLVTWIKGKISSIATNGTIARYPISELYCKLQKIIGYQRFESGDDSVLVLEDDTYSYQRQVDNTFNNTRIVAQIADFHKWLESQNIEYLYVMEPCKISPVNEDNIYKGYVDYQKHNMDTLAALMEQSDVSFLNLQEKASQTGDINKLFFRTDHHWKPSTALWAANIIAENLNDSYGFQIDVSQYDPNNFIAKDYRAYFLGSQGKKVTLGVSKPDDFELILPTHDIELHVTIESAGINTFGTMGESLIDYTQLKEESYPYKYYTKSAYTAYGYGDPPLITIENEHVKNNLNVLILRDSYVDCMGPFFSLGVHKLVLIDLRSFTGSIRAYILEQKPDIVITMLNGGSFDLEENYELHTNLLDYR